MSTSNTNSTKLTIAAGQIVSKNTGVVNSADIVYNIGANTDGSAKLTTE